LYYNRANVYVQRNDLPHAIDDYSHAIILDQHLAEAYYNRGLTFMSLQRNSEAVSDLSKAGELGLYTAYSIIKKIQNKN
jgi:tetratricopeptide (TPR) repeat protein